MTSEPFRAVTAEDDCPSYKGRFTISIYGGAGSGKSTLAKALAASLGEANAARIPTDYFLLPVRADHQIHPLQYDLPMIERLLRQADGTQLTTPDFDFTCFARRSETGGRSFVLRPVMILDGMRPYPGSGCYVFVHAPEQVREQRIRDRDRGWHTQAIANWPTFQLTLEDINRLQYPIDISLDGTRDTASNIAMIRAWLNQDK